MMTYLNGSKTSTRIRLYRIRFESDSRIVSIFTSPMFTFKCSIEHNLLTMSGKLDFTLTLLVLLPLAYKEHHPLPFPWSFTILVAWVTTPPNIKLKFDGLIRDSSVAAGIIIRDHLGNLVHATAFNLGHINVFIAEATTLHRGIEIASQLGIKHITIEGDNLLVVNAIKHRISPWLIANIIEDYSLLLLHFDSWQVSHPRGN